MQTAFNYQTQKWETGAQARTTRIAQLQLEIATLTGHRGGQYAAFLGVDQNAALARANALLLETLTNKS